MNTDYKAEADIDQVLDMHLEEAREGDPFAGSRVHKLLCDMLRETEDPLLSGAWWLTPHAGKVLADLLGNLAQCEYPSWGDPKAAHEQFCDAVLTATLLKRRRGMTDRRKNYWRSETMAQMVAYAIARQLLDGEKRNVTAAATYVHEEWGDLFRTQTMHRTFKTQTVRRTYNRFNKRHKEASGESLEDAALRNLQRKS